MAKTHDDDAGDDILQGSEITCWACQKPVANLNRLASLDDSTVIPCCITCWQQIPIAQRLEIAIKFRDRSDHGLGIEQTLSLVRDLIHETIQGGWQRKTPDEFGRN